MCLHIIGMTMQKTLLIFMMRAVMDGACTLHMIYVLRMADLH